MRAVASTYTKEERKALEAKSRELRAERESDSLTDDERELRSWMQSHHGHD